MQSPGALPEARARALSRLLLAGWLLLILSLWRTDLALPLAGWSGSLGLAFTRLFWGLLLPLVILLLLASGTTLWRRICPLAFVSQLGRSLRWQRRRHGPSSQLATSQLGTALVDPGSWLGRHHLKLQWSLLIIGLGLRLLLVNTVPQALALLFSATLLAALLVGWRWDGKTWCHYVCPMGPVEAVLAGLRPMARSPGLLPESICRTISADGRERSTCVHCQSPCLDIDASRAYWHGLRHGRSLTLAWWSYPGLVLAFFVLQVHLRFGDIPAIPAPLLALESQLPHWFTVPLLLLGGSLLSLLLFALLRRAGLSLHRTRLLATASAVNIFFLFSEASLGLWHGWPGLGLQALVLLLSVRWLRWGWRRES
jgi:hypothetical protein